MEKINRPKKKRPEAFRYSKMPDPLELYFFVSLIKGIVWLVKTPIKWVIKKMK